MDKEKILEASRSENKNGDEMKKLNDMKAAKAGLIASLASVIFIVLFLLVIGQFSYMVVHIYG